MCPLVSHGDGDSSTPGRLARASTKKKQPRSAFAGSGGIPRGACRSGQEVEDPRQIHPFDYKPELPVNGELELDIEKPFPKHMRLERMVFRLVQAYPSGRVHTRQIRDHLLNEGKMNGTHADISRLHRVFTRSGGFERIGHGYYQVKPDYRPKPVVSETEARLFKELGVSRRS